MCQQCRQLHIIHECYVRCPVQIRLGNPCAWGLIVAIEHGTVETLVETIVELGHRDFLQCESLAKGFLHLQAAFLDQALVLIESIVEGDGTT